MYDVMIIGAGASGLTAAVYAAKGGRKVAVLERNNAPAKKIYATGNGHCNYLNAKAEGFELLKAELEKIGIFGTEDEDGRYYPRSREAASVVSALVNAAEKNGAEIICDCHVTDIQKTASGFKVISKDGTKRECAKLIIASGGKAGIQFGCYGEGYRWAQYMGHRLVKPVPALVAMETGSDISGLAGVRVRGLARLICGGALVAEDKGEIQFTKDGISGICVMNLSRNVRLAGDKSYELSLDLFGDLSGAELKEMLEAQKQTLGCSAEGLLPEKLKNYVTAKYGDSAESLAAALKDLRFDIKGTKGWADAQVTSGGVPLEELDPDTMESLKIPGLYFTGEITDYDGPCGGYNLSHAFRTGMLAGAAASEE